MTISKEHWRNYTDIDKRQGLQEKPVKMPFFFTKNFASSGSEIEPGPSGSEDSN